MDGWNVSFIKQNIAALKMKKKKKEREREREKEEEKKLTGTKESARNTSLHIYILFISSLIARDILEKKAAKCKMEVPVVS